MVTGGGHQGVGDISGDKLGTSRKGWGPGDVGDTRTGDVGMDLGHGGCRREDTGCPGDQDVLGTSEKGPFTLGTWESQLAGCPHPQGAALRWSRDRDTLGGDGDIGRGWGRVTQVVTPSMSDPRPWWSPPPLAVSPQSLSLRLPCGPPPMSDLCHHGPVFAPCPHPHVPVPLVPTSWCPCGCWCPHG